MENQFLTSFPLLFLPLLVAPSPPVSILPSLNTAFPSVPPVWLLGSPLMTSDGERGEKVGERGWSLGDVCLRYSASSSLYTLRSRGSTHYLPQFCSQNIAAWDKWFSSPSWSISEGSAHWVFWALSRGIWSDGENMWKIMGWSKCLHVWITITPLLWKGFKYFWRVHVFKNDLLYSTFFPWLLTCQS